MYKPTNEEYYFTDIEDIFEFVTLENIDMFIVDFKNMLLMGLDFAERQKPYTKNPITPNAFTWIDDGKHEAKLNIYPTNE